jgi:hypothetical protein
MHDKAKIWNGEGSFNTLLGITSSSTKLPKKSDTFKKVEWVTGCCMMLRNSTLSINGLFNERFFLYYEDVELSFRLREIGYELHYLPSCKMYHEASVSASVEKEEGILSPIIHYYVSRNHIWFVRRYGKKLFYPINIIYNGGYYALMLLYFIVRRRKVKFAYLVKGIKEGVFTPKNVIWPEQY